MNTECNRNCDTSNPDNFTPSSSHFLDCPVWLMIFHYEHDTVEDILG